jgi:ATP-binding cassette subfamily B protein
MSSFFSEFGRVATSLRTSVALVPRAGRRQLALATLLMLLVALSTNLPALLVGNLVDRFLARNSASVRLAVPYLLAIFALICVRELAQVGRRFEAEKAATSLERELRVSVTSAVLHADQEQFADVQSGSLYGRMNRGVEGATRLVKLTFLDFLPSVILALVAISLVWSRDWRVGVAVTTLLPFMTSIVAWQLRDQRGVRVSLLRRKESVDGAIVELLRDLDSVKSLDAVGFELSRVESVAEQLQRTELGHHVRMAWFDALKFGTEGLAYIAVTTIAITLAAAGTISTGTILSVTLLFMGVMAPVRELHRVFDEGHESSLQAEDLHRLLKVSPDSSYSAGSASLAAVRKATEVIVCERVTIRYRNRDIPAVAGVDLHVPEGAFVGLCGPAGCGKSTLVKALMRLVHRQSGAIRLFGQPLEAFDRGSLARVISYVPQSSFLVTGTVTENIAYGLPDVSSEDVMIAAKRACIHEEILAFSRGYDTLVGEAGVRLSGGQRQRVALARVFLRRPRLVILDEATSNLDNLNESAIQRELENAGFTMLAIAHRLSTLRNADEIFVMDVGRIAERGTYEELIRNHGLFHSLDAAGRIS